MANKPLKSITFPGLSDRYTVPSKTSDLTNDSGFITASNIPTIDTSIDSSSVDTEVASAKAVYDYVQSAIGTAIGGAY